MTTPEEKVWIAQPVNRERVLTFATHDEIVAFLESAGYALLEEVEAFEFLGTVGYPSLSDQLAFEVWRGEEYNLIVPVPRENRARGYEGYWINLVRGMCCAFGRTVDDMIQDVRSHARAQKAKR